MRPHASVVPFCFLFLFAITTPLPAQVTPAPPDPATQRAALSAAALAEVGVTKTYDPAYVKLAYPGGDVPIDRGVCTDVVIRALRAVGVDLQVLVHEDKKKAPEAYPHDWPGPFLDSNIDHRRIPNLMVFFKREGKEMPKTTDPADYLPGDIVVWRLSSGLLHTGLVTTQLAPGTNRPLMVHNIGQGAQCQDALFAFTMVAHYRWFNYSYSPIVTNPAWDFVTSASKKADFSYLPRTDEIYQLNLDLYGDGKPTIFLTFGRWGSKSGNTWIAYTPTEGGYNRVEQTTDGNSIVFRLDGFYSFGKVTDYSDRGGLYVLYPGKGGGNLVHYDIQKGTASVKAICSIDYSKPKDMTLAALILGHEVGDKELKDHPTYKVLSAASLVARGQ